jgi:hypothetical protein
VDFLFVVGPTPNASRRLPFNFTGNVITHFVDIATCFDAARIRHDCCRQVLKPSYYLTLM